MNWPAILFILGIEMLAFGFAMTLPALFSLGHNDAEWIAFLTSALLVIFIGGNLTLMNRGRTQVLGHRDGFMLTVLTWTVLGTLGALPFWLSSHAPTLVDAIFESISGLTSTGATVLSGLDTMGHGVLFWRALLQWLGGMGIIVLAVAVLPFLRVGGLQLYKSEFAGVVKDKLQPRLQETAKLLWGVYVLLTSICALAYYIAGMNAFDAICHAFTTVATGGFANYDASFAAFENPAIEWIAIVFMLIGGTSFALHYVFLTKNNIRTYLENEEFKFYLSIVASAVALVTLGLVLTDQFNGTDALRKSAFQVVSLMTTTGYASADYSAWHVFSPMIILVLIFIGGCSGSTSGGMKAMRVLMIAKQSGREMYNLLHPSGVSHVKIGKRTVPDNIMQAVWSFAGIFIICYIIIALLLAAHGLDLVTAFSAAAATITCAGPGLGDVGPASNYASLPATAKLICCFAMLLGRLEVFTLLLVFNPQFWRR